MFDGRATTEGEGEPCLEEGRSYIGGGHLGGHLGEADVGWE